MSKDTGGPAFPCTNEQLTAGNSEHGDAAPGMTLRDWFAGQALAGFASDNTALSIKEGETVEEAHRRCWQMFANSAYVAADAMIAERTKP